jgi:FKBP-type peptidyl-prolyl cis-trans isomerase FklB
MKQKFLVGLLLSTLAITPAFAGMTATTADLSTDQAKASYTIGFNMGKNVAAQKIDFNQAAFFSGFTAGSTGAAPAMTPAQMKDAMDKFKKDLIAKHEALEKAAAEKNEKDGKAAMKAFQAQPGVKVIDSNLAYKVITLGTGATPTKNDSVTVKYEGKLTDGTVFDSTKAHGDKPATFPLAHVIPAMQKVLTLLPVGTHVEFLTAPADAYGATGMGPIGPNATLHFDVEVLSIAPVKAPTPTAPAVK